jgi:2-dehydropantoate 2-reductase
MLPPTREHESSMLQSLRAGRRTEMEALNGALARLGREHGLATPCNDLVAGLVRHLEARGRVTRPTHSSSSGLTRSGAMDCSRCV